MFRISPKLSIVEGLIKLSKSNNEFPRLYSKLILGFPGHPDMNTNYATMKKRDSDDYNLNEQMDIEINDQLSEFDQYLHQYQFSNTGTSNNWPVQAANTETFDLQPHQESGEQNQDCAYDFKLNHKSLDQLYSPSKELTYRYENQLTSPEVTNYSSHHTHSHGHAHNHHHQWPNNHTQYFTTYQEYLPCRDSEKTYACSNI